MTGLRRALLLVAFQGLVVGLVAVAIVLSSDYADAPAVSAALGVFIGWSFVGVGLLAWWRRPENRFGVLMTIVGFTWCLSGLGASNAPDVFIVGFILGPLPYAFLIHMLLGFPTGALRGWLDRVLVCVAYLICTVVQWAAVPFVDTTRSEYDGPRNPLLISRHDDLVDRI